MALGRKTRARIIPVTLFAAASSTLMVYTAPGLSLGLGAPNIQTMLGQPLLAEIPISDNNRKFSIEEIRVRQVRGESARQLGFDLAADSPAYPLSLIERDSNLFLQIRSETQMREPYVSILVEIEWPTGKLYRDYNLLLDLDRQAPKLAQSSAGAISSPIPTGTSLHAPAANYRPASSTTQKYPAAAQVAQVNAPITPDWEVGSGDTLSQIAQKIRPDDQIKLAAVVEAIYRLNPQAFEDGDIHKLRYGAILTLPGANDFAQMPRWDKAAEPQVTSRIKPAPAAHKSSPPPKPEVVTSSSATTRSRYQVKPGDTLSQIAQRLRLDPTIPLRQMVAAIYAENPHAFRSNDINQLIVGANLIVTQAALPDVASITQNESAEQPIDPPTEPVKPEEPVKSEAIRSNATNAESEVLPEPHFHLSSDPDTAEIRPSEKTSMTDQIDAVAEEVDKVNRENEQMRERIDRIEQSEHIAMLERMLQLQASKIKELQAQLGADSPAIGNSNSNGDIDAMALMEEVARLPTETKQGLQTPPANPASPAITTDDSPLASYWLAILAGLSVLITLILLRRNQLIAWLSERRHTSAIPAEPDAAIAVEPSLSWSMPTATPQFKEPDADATDPQSHVLPAFQQKLTLDRAVNKPATIPEVRPPASVDDALDAAHEGMIDQVPPHNNPGSAQPDSLPETLTEASIKSAKVDTSVTPTQRQETLNLDELSFDQLSGGDDFESLFGSDSREIKALFDDFAPETDARPAVPDVNDPGLKTTKATTTSGTPMRGAEVKNAIESKTRNYKRSSLDEELDNWIYRSIPTARISETKDVIDEARVYAAYGRYDEAEKMLLEHLHHNPDDPLLLQTLDELRQRRADLNQNNG